MSKRSLVSQIKEKTLQKIQGMIMKKLFKLHTIYFMLCALFSVTHASAAVDPWEDPAYVAEVMAMVEEVEREYAAEAPPEGAAVPVAPVVADPVVPVAPAMVAEPDADDEDDMDGDAAPIQAVIVAPPVVIPPYIQARINDHAAAFPFAAQGRPFLANIQKAWTTHWLGIVSGFPAASAAQKKYPMMRLRFGESSVVPSFGWRFISRTILHQGTKCQMCGKPVIHEVFKLHNPAMLIERGKTLCVGNECALFMQITLEQLRDIARDNDRPLA